MRFGLAGKEHQICAGMARTSRRSRRVLAAERRMLTVQGAGDGRIAAIPLE